MSKTFHSLRTRLIDDAGGALVEFAIVVPLLLGLVIGIFEFGRAWNQYQVITDASREGARRAVIRDGANKQTVVSSVVTDRLRAAGMLGDSESLTATYTADCASFTAPTGQESAIALYGCGWGKDTGEEARVVIRAPYTFGFLGPVIGLLQADASIGSITIDTNYVMRNE